jgi:hypothetical protein
LVEAGMGGMVGGRGWHAGVGWRCGDAATDT